MSKKTIARVATKRAASQSRTKRAPGPSTERALAAMRAFLVASPVDTVTADYDRRVDGLIAVLEMYRRLLTAPSTCELARKKIDDVDAALFRSSRSASLRIELLQSLDMVAYLVANTSDDGARTLRTILTAPLAAKMTPDDARVAVAVWRDDRPRPQGLPRKWTFLADLVARLGLGTPKPATFKREWANWTIDNARLRDITDRR